MFLACELWTRSLASSRPRNVRIRNYCSKKAEIFVGAKAQLIRRFSREDVELFAKISGDHNPLHLSQEFASKSMFAKPVVHGLLVASLFSAIFGTKFPGEGSIYLSQTLRFEAPGLRPAFLHPHQDLTWFRPS